jgi:hypothetical protein
MALMIADGEGAPAVTEQALLAIVPAGGTFKHDTLIWIVRFEGACLPPHNHQAGLSVGGEGLAWHCGRRVDVLINATTGEEIGTFTY